MEFAVRDALPSLEKLCLARRTKEVFHQCQPDESTVPRTALPTRRGPRNRKAHEPSTENCKEQRGDKTAQNRDQIKPSC